MLLFLVPSSLLSKSDGDSCSDNSSISSSESDLSEEEDAVLGDQITLNSSNVEPLVDYGLNGDNLDWQRRPSIYSANKDTESIHWFNLLCYRNRVSNWALDDNQRIGPIMDLPNSSFLPSNEEHANLRKDFIILVLCILVKYCEYFHQFLKLVPSHIPHQFGKEMKQQSEVVSALLYNVMSACEWQMELGHDDADGDDTHNDLIMIIVMIKVKVVFTTHSAVMKTHKNPFSWVK